MKNWEDVKIAPEFNEQGVACYRLTGADFLNEYYIISEAETRKLLNTPAQCSRPLYAGNPGGRVKRRRRAADAGCRARAGRGDGISF